MFTYYPKPFASKHACTSTHIGTRVTQEQRMKLAVTVLLYLLDDIKCTFRTILDILIPHGCKTKVLLYM